MRVLVLAYVLVSRPCHGANLIHDDSLCYELMMFPCLVSDHVTLLGAFEICAAERNSNAIVALPLNLNARLALRKEAQCQGGGSQVLCKLHQRLLQPRSAISTQNRVKASGSGLLKPVYSNKIIIIQGSLLISKIEFFISRWIFFKG